MTEKQDAVPEGINDLPDPSTFAAAEGETRRKKKQRDLIKPEPFSINSLMDIMTILLVFLIKSYSSDPVTLKQTEDLKPPFSSSQLKPDPSTTMTLTLKGILVDDEPAVQIATADGQVAESDREGGGFLISPVFTQLEAAVEHQKEIASYNASAEFKGLLTIISDRNVPFSLISQAMYTAGQAGFTKFKFLVVKGG